MSKADLRRNRRHSPRRYPKGSVKVNLTLGVLGLGENLAVRVLNLSETGVRLIVKDELKMGQEVTVTLEGASHARPLKLSGRVVWNCNVGQNVVQAGVAFEKRLSYGDYLKLT